MTLFWVIGQGVMWVMLGILAFVVVLAVGNIMAAKPKPHEVALDVFRMQARKLGLTPKMVACPPWLLASVERHKAATNTPNTRTHSSTPMVMYYGLVNDDWQLPQAAYEVLDGHWQLLDDVDTTKVDRYQRHHKANQLNQQALMLPDKLAKYVFGLSIKANSIMLFWDDARFCAQMTPDDKLLVELKEALNKLAESI